MNYVHLTSMLLLILPMLNVDAADTNYVGIGADSGIDISGPMGQHLSLENQLWGEGWSYASYKTNISVAGNTYVAESQSKIKSGATIKLAIQATSEQRQLQTTYQLSSDQDSKLTLATITIPVQQQAFNGGSVTAHKEDGTNEEKPLPMDKSGFSDKVSKLVLKDISGKETTVHISPAMTISSDGALRLILAQGEIKAGEQPAYIINVDFPGELAFYPSVEQYPDEPGKEHWFTWDPALDYSADTVTDMSNWLEKPAGLHGRVTRENDQLIYNGKPIQFWGVNVCYDRGCAPSKEIADKRAKLYAKNGINAVRFHKYADVSGWGGIQSKDSFAELDPTALDRMDYFVSVLKAQGIYVKLSATFMVKLGPADVKHVPYMAEFGELKGGRVNTDHGSIYLSKELQDIQILQIQNVLKHKNPYTGLTYAEDPAIMVLELFNEDSALWNGIQGQLRKSKTLRARTGLRFTEWLLARYKSEAGIVEAWGEAAINSFGYEKLTGESIADKTVLPVGGAWYFDPDQLDGSQKPKKQRLLDTMEFLYVLQNECYARMTEGLRATGYSGEILSSNWQAGRAYSHYLNLHSDYQIGLIDRHNYFGGNNPASMLRVPGSGMLSTGMQQVTDRPFMLSEWIHVYPNQWGVEGPAIIGAYGMGLQGWDVSFMFQNSDRGDYLDKLGGQWEVSAPQILGVFPAVARQVLRNDVKQGEVISVRSVDVPSLVKGKMGFDEKVIQQHDVKVFDGDKVPSRSMALGRVVVDFTKEFKQTEKLDVDALVKNGVYTSNTGELEWTEGQEQLDGFFTINTAATQAVVGFSKDKVQELDDLSICSHNDFAAIYVSAHEQDKNLKTSKRLLIVAMGRAHNTGMKYFNNEKVISAGKGPILMEPILATITLKRSVGATVYLCDQDGKRSDKTIALNKGQFTINGRESKSIYYEVVY